MPNAGRRRVLFGPTIQQLVPRDVRARVEDRLPRETYLRDLRLEFSRGWRLGCARKWRLHARRTGREPAASRHASEGPRRTCVAPDPPIIFTFPNALVAQLDRASASGAEGHRFESCRAHPNESPRDCGGFCFGSRLAFELLKTPTPFGRWRPLEVGGVWKFAPFGSQRRLEVSAVSGWRSSSALVVSVDP